MVVLNEALCCIKVVNYLAVLLLLVHSVGQRIITNEFVNYGFKYDIEVLDQQVLFLGGVDKHLASLHEE